MSSFDQERALRLGRARTRKGSLVILIGAAPNPDGNRDLLFGQVLDVPCGKRSNLYTGRACWWYAGGLSLSGDDDLMDFVTPDCRK